MKNLLKILKYDVNQPRDKNGMWTKGGGGGKANLSLGSANSLPNPTSILNAITAQYGGSTERVVYNPEYPESQPLMVEEDSQRERLRADLLQSGWVNTKIQSYEATYYGRMADTDHVFEHPLSKTSQIIIRNNNPRIDIRGTRKPKPGERKPAPGSDEAEGWSFMPDPNNPGNGFHIPPDWYG